MFFSLYISADSCTLNLLYVISNLSCKIDQRELERAINILYNQFFVLEIDLLL